ncbi:MAG: bifunctional oligoribonuclease/PAP phosphatase NrnA [Lachnospiraceae bacterium]|nr:bifunctional oligoribonuclease/PAP phosphatase NrnA [Lachnospiraceae bacterium]
MYHQILEQIKKHNRIIIHRHSKPDGDALGSQIGLKHILKENFPEKEIYVVGDAAGHYSFMDDVIMDELTDELYTDALAIILDCGGRHLISDDRYQTAATTVRFDHHIFAEEIAEYEVVDTSYESCCGLLTNFAIECGLTISPLAAKSLYTGMVTDSGRFRYDSTNANTFRMAAHLMEQGIDTNEIFGNLYAEDFENKKNKAAFILKIKFTEHNVAYIYTTKEEVATLNIDTFSISRGMVGTMGDTKGVDIWVNFTETEEGVLCELRSSKYNINPVAVKYGGGGHQKASGATVASREVAMQMLADLDLMMQENL